MFTILVYLCIGPMLAIPRTASTSYSMFAFLTARLDGMTLAGIPIDWVLRTVFSLAFFAGAYQLAKRPSLALAERAVFKPSFLNFLVRS